MRSDVAERACRESGGLPERFDQQTSDLIQLIAPGVCGTSRPNRAAPMFPELRMARFAAVASHPGQRRVVDKRAVKFAHQWLRYLHHHSPARLQLNLHWLAGANSGAAFEADRPFVQLVRQPR